MFPHNQLLRAEQEIKNGLRFKAVNRLRNVINQFPDNMEARTKLAQLYYEAGFYDAAGLFWMLTEPVEEHVKQCTVIYKASVNYSPVQILKDIKYRGNVSGLSPYAAEVLKSLEEEKRTKNASSKAYNKRLEAAPDSKSDSWGAILLVVILIVFLLGFINGIGSIWIFFF
jgi:hypothetical protein